MGNQYSSLPMPERFWAKVDKSQDCWLYLGGLDGWGYGVFWYPSPVSKSGKAHIWAWEQEHGPVPEHLQLDHMCHTVDNCLGGICVHRRCVRVKHLKLATPRENFIRGHGVYVGGLREAAKTHCPQGHPYDELNTYTNPASGARCCRTCTNAANRRHRRNKRA